MPIRPAWTPRPCPCCGGRMIVIETFAPGCEPRDRSAPTMPRSGSTLHDDVQRHARRNAAVTPRCFSTGGASACSDVGDRHPSGTRTFRLTGSSEPRMAPMGCSSSIRYAAGPIDHAPPPPASRSNRHRARCTVGAPSPATSCIAGLPTPADPGCGSVRHGRHPQTFTVPDSCTATLRHACRGCDTSRSARRRRSSQRASKLHHRGGE